MTAETETSCGARACTDPEVARLRDLLLEQAWGDPPDDATAKAWTDMAEALAGVFEAMARAAEAPTLLAEVADQLALYDDEVLTAPRSPLPPAEVPPAARRYKALMETPGAVLLDLRAREPMGAKACEAIVERWRLGAYVSVSASAEDGPMLCASPEALPIADAVVDRVDFGEGLDRLLRPDLALAEIWRVLKPGGAVRIGAPFTAADDRRRPDYLRFTAAYFEQVMPALGFVELSVAVPMGSISTLRPLLRDFRPRKRLPPAAARRLAVSRAALLALLAGVEQVQSLLHPTPGAYRAVVVHALKPGADQDPAGAGA